MGRLRRCLTAIDRYRHSLGFGIHSPFAFGFIRGVLREQSPYYAYEAIADSRREAVSMIPHGLLKRHVMSTGDAFMLFRVVCRFNPSSILQCGVYAGVDSVAMLEVDSRSRLMVCPIDEANPVFDRVTSRFGDRISRCRSVEEGADRYFASPGSDRPFVLINDTCGHPDVIAGILSQVVARGSVAVVRGIDRDKMGGVWQTALDGMACGMSFSNGVTGIITAFAHLPRQHFSLWF